MKVIERMSKISKFIEVTYKYGQLGFEYNNIVSY